MNFPSPGGHSIVKNTGGWLDSLGSGILVEKIFRGSSKILIWTNVRGQLKWFIWIIRGTILSENEIFEFPSVFEVACITQNMNAGKQFLIQQ